MAEQVRSLLQSLPAIMFMALVYKLLFNELLHIVVEPLRMEEQVTEEKVLESVRRYNREYGGPASWADVKYDMAPEPVRRMINEWWNSPEGIKAEQEIKEILSRLVQQGKLRVVEGGYAA